MREKREPLKQPHLERERGRVHREAIRDSKHAFSMMEVWDPSPWKRRTVRGVPRI